MLGVCLPITVLRRLVEKGAPLLASDDDCRLHCVAVSEAKRRNALSELMHKELERRYALAVRQAAVARCTPTLGAWWRVVAEANEDLADRHRGRPSGVHFLRFELPDEMRAALQAGQAATLGCAHPAYAWQRAIPPLTLRRLCQDFSDVAQDAVVTGRIVAEADTAARDGAASMNPKLLGWVEWAVFVAGVTILWKLLPYPAVT